MGGGGAAKGGARAMDAYEQLVLGRAPEVYGEEEEEYLKCRREELREIREQMLTGKSAAEGERPQRSAAAMRRRAVENGYLGATGAVHAGGAMVAKLHSGATTFKNDILDQMVLLGRAEIYEDLNALKSKKSKN